jgi:hypothetical protein
MKSQPSWMGVDGLFMITADDLAANALERFDDGRGGNHKKNY